MPSLNPTPSPQGDLKDIVGTTLCACQPTVWNFTLDLTVTCAPSNDSFFGGPLVEEYFCLPPQLQDGIVSNVDFANNQVDSIQILELNQFMETIVQYLVPGGPFEQGTTFVYESILERYNTTMLNSTALPSSLIVIYEGVNAFNQSLKGSWSVQFSTSCQSLDFTLDDKETEMLFTRIVSFVCVHSRSLSLDKFQVPPLNPFLPLCIYRALRKARPILIAHWTERALTFRLQRRRECHPLARLQPSQHQLYKPKSRHVLHETKSRHELHETKSRRLIDPSCHLSIPC